MIRPPPDILLFPQYPLHFTLPHKYFLSNINPKSEIQNAEELLALSWPTWKRKKVIQTRKQTLVCRQSSNLCIMTGLFGGTCTIKLYEEAHHVTSLDRREGGVHLQLLDEMPPSPSTQSRLWLRFRHISSATCHLLSINSLSLTLTFPFQIPIPSNLIEPIQVLHFDLLLLRVSYSSATVIWFVFWLFQPLMSLNYAFIWSFHFSFWCWRWLEVNFHSILP